MRALIAVVLAGAVITGVLKHRNDAQSDASAQSPALAQQPPIAQGEPSQHNWPKRALDRAADVKRQVSDQRNEDGTR